MRTYGRRMGLGFGLAFAVLCAIGALAVRGAFMMEETAAKVADSHDTVRLVMAVQSALTAVETAQRSYLLTADKAHLRPYENGIRDARAGMDALRRRPLVVERDEEFADAERRMRELFALFRQRVQQRGDAPLEQVMRTVQVGEGRRQMEQLRLSLQGLMDGADNERAQRSAAMADTTRIVKRVATIGALIGLALLVAVWVRLQRLLTRTVGDAARDVREQARELESSAQQQASATRETATTTVQIATTMHELRNASGQIARRAAEVEETAASGSRAARDGSEAITATRDTVEAMRRQIDHVVAQMLALGRKVQGAATVLGTVEELAERTNILAINATIEAVAAGDQGERFQAVADEIRRLAERMGGDAQEIRRQLEEITNASNATIMSTETGFKAVEASALRFEDISRALRLIEDRVATTESATQEIRLATHQQSSAIQQLETALGGVAQATSDAERSAQRNLSTAERLAGTAQRLSEFVTPPARWPWARSAHPAATPG